MGASIFKVVRVHPVLKIESVDLVVKRANIFFPFVFYDIQILVEILESNGWFRLITQRKAV